MMLVVVLRQSKGRRFKKASPLVVGIDWCCVHTVRTGVFQVILFALPILFLRDRRNDYRWVIAAGSPVAPVFGSVGCSCRRRGFFNVVVAGVQRGRCNVPAILYKLNQSETVKPPMSGCPHGSGRGQTAPRAVVVIEKST